jgi:transposase-like protein
MLHCPRCGSTRIYLLAGGFTGYRYHCKACGYEGALVISTEEEGEEDRGDS